MVRAALGELSIRDRALVLVALVTGMRRSELAALRWADVEPTSEGLLAWVRRSKTDQTGEGRPVAVPRGRGDSCPVRALRDLRAERERAGEAGSSDRVFGCSDWTVAQVIKRVAELAGGGRPRGGDAPIRAREHWGCAGVHPTRRAGSQPRCKGGSRSARLIDYRAHDSAD